MPTKLPSIKYDPNRGWMEDAPERTPNTLPFQGSSRCTKDGDEFFTYPGLNGVEMIDVDTNRWRSRQGWWR